MKSRALHDHACGGAIFAPFGMRQAWHTCGEVPLEERRVPVLTLSKTQAKACGYQRQISIMIFKGTSIRSPTRVVWRRQRTRGKVERMLTPLY